MCSGSMPPRPPKQPQARPQIHEKYDVSLPSWSFKRSPSKVNPPKPSYFEKIYKAWKQENLHEQVRCIVMWTHNWPAMISMLAHRIQEDQQEVLKEQHRVRNRVRHERLRKQQQQQPQRPQRGGGQPDEHQQPDGQQQQQPSSSGSSGSGNSSGIDLPLLRRMGASEALGAIMEEKDEEEEEEQEAEEEGGEEDGESRDSSTEVDADSDDHGLRIKSCSECDEPPAKKKRCGIDFRVSFGFCYEGEDMLLEGPP